MLLFRGFADIIASMLRKWRVLPTASNPQAASSNEFVWLCSASASIPSAQENYKS